MAKHVHRLLLPTCGFVMIYGEIMMHIEFEDFMNLKTLRVIDFSRNRFKGIMTFFFRLSYS